MSQSDKGGRRSLSVLDVPQTTKTWNYNDSTWSDLLTNFNGESITYDEIGNPLTIGSKSLTWTGRQLQSITDNENAISYTYNGDGLRTSKTVNGETINYYYNGSILAGQKSGDDTLVFMYDNNSDIFGFIYNDVEYYYIKNAQNDVVAIADADGSILVKYEYDAWGKVVSITDANGNEITDTVDQNAGNDIDEAETVGVNNSTDIAETSEIAGVDAGIDPTNADEPTIETATEEQTSESETDSVSEIDSEIAKIANLNPILYRSYYYDKETEWYYLNTRSYSPDMCRFINADGYIQTGQSLLDKNMFAYCLNNPVNMLDKNGNLAKELFTYIAGKGLYYIAIITIVVVVIAAIMASYRNTSVYEEIYGSISYQFSKAKTRAKARAEARREARQKKKKAECFPLNPLKFNPKGLEMKIYPGTKNGRIIKWMDPLTNEAIFEWDEDFNNGAHYHIQGVVDENNIRIHFKSGTTIPEPWQSLYF